MQRNLNTTFKWPQILHKESTNIYLCPFAYATCQPIDGSHLISFVDIQLFSKINTCIISSKDKDNKLEKDDKEKAREYNSNELRLIQDIYHEVLFVDQRKVAHLPPNFSTVNFSSPSYDSASPG